MLESLLETESRDDDEKYEPPVSSSHSVYCSTGPVQSVSLVPRTRAAAVPANEHISTLIPCGSDLLNTINQSTGKTPTVEPVIIRQIDSNSPDGITTEGC